MDERPGETRVKPGCSPEKSQKSRWEEIFALAKIDGFLPRWLTKKWKRINGKKSYYMFKKKIVRLMQQKNGPKYTPNGVDFKLIGSAENHAVIFEQGMDERPSEARVKSRKLGGKSFC